MSADVGQPWLRRGVGRKRLAVGWGLIVFALMSLAAWACSLWVEVTWARGEWCVQCVNGSVSLYWQRPPYASALRFDRVYPSPVWWVGPIGRRASESPTNKFTNLRLGLGGGYHIAPGGPGAFDEWAVAVLIYPFTIVAGVAGVVAVRSGRRARRRAKSGLCGRCGYDLRGLGVEVECPECGDKEVDGSAPKPLPDGRVSLGQGKPAP